MEAYWSVGLVQLLIAGVMAFPYFRREDKISPHDARRILVSIFLPVGLLVCFALELGTGHTLFHGDGFLEFGYITGLSSPFLLLGRTRSVLEFRGGRLISGIMLGILFWLSVFAMIRLTAVAFIVVIPVIGLLWFVPFFTVIHSCWILQKSQLDAGKSLSYGLSFLLIFQLLMNLWSPTPFAWFHLFNPLELYPF